MLSDTSVSKSQLVAYHVLKSAIAHFNQKPSELSDDQRKTVSKTAQKSYELEHKILASDEAQDIVIPSHSIEASLKEMEERYETPDEFLDDLRSNGLNYDTLQTSIRRELWVEAVLDRVSTGIDDVFEKDVIEFYQNNVDKFQTVEKRTARHILITINDDYEENKLPAVEARIETLLKQLNDGADFAKLAAENSECPTAMNGGEVGTIAKGHLYPEIDEVLFLMQEGEFNGPIETEIGLHIVKCEKIHLGGQVSLFDAKEQIVAHLLEIKRTHAQRLWLRKLETK